MSSKLILVVEDDHDIRTQMVEALEIEGYRVMAAENGKVALNMLLKMPAQDLPRGMILDLMMPEMDGETLMETIDRDYKQKLGGIKIIVATARSSHINLKTMSPTLEKIQKPFNLSDLYQKVERHFG